MASPYMPVNSGGGGVPPRYRVNAHQSAKGVWQIDATVEYHDIVLTRSTDPKDIGKTADTTLGAALLSLIHETEEQLKADGKTLAGESD